MVSKNRLDISVDEFLQMYPELRNSYKDLMKKFKPEFQCSYPYAKEKYVGLAVVAENGRCAVTYISIRPEENDRILNIIRKTFPNFGIIDEYPKATKPSYSDPRSII